MARSLAKVKEKPSLQEKVKQFFGFKVSAPLNFDHLRTDPYNISVELIKDILPENPVHTRLKCLNELCEIVLTKHLKDNTIESLYSGTKDLLDVTNTAETRHIVFQFYCFIVQGQLEKMTIMRSVFFNLIKNHKIPEDSLQRLELLKLLSNNGKNIKYFEEEIGLFLFEWFPEILNQGKVVSEFLPLIVNIVKYNPASLDEEIVAGYLDYVCLHCGKASAEEDIMFCLEVMDAVLCYIHLPMKVLNHFIFVLCLTVSVDKFSQLSWKLMRNLLGTTLGHTTILLLCKLLQDNSKQTLPLAFQGAIFFLSAALWGTKKVLTLMHSPSSVLPSFLMALDYNLSVVANEVVIALHRLVESDGSKLDIVTWNAILDITERLLKYPELQHEGLPCNPLSSTVHDFITTVEKNKHPAFADKIYGIIENCIHNRDEQSTISLMQYRARAVGVDTPQTTIYLLEKFFRNETREIVQLEVIEILRNIAVQHAHFYRDNSAIDQTLLHYMQHIDAISSLAVRVKSVEFLIEIAESSNKNIFFDILNIIEKVLKRPFDMFSSSSCKVYDVSKKNVFCDVEAAVIGLIRIFNRKLHTLPSSHCMQVYDLLITHAQAHYKHLPFSKEIMKIRKLVIEFFLEFRSNSQKQVGHMANDGKVVFGVYFLCNKREVSDSSTALLATTPLNIEAMLNLIITALKYEKDWLILELLFEKLPKLLQNKAIVVNGNLNITALCCTLKNWINEKSTSFPSNLYNIPTRFTRTDFQMHVFPVLTSLIMYQSSMEPYMQRILINCLESGLVTSSAKVCIEGLTLCTLEMKSMMIKLMPAVLDKLSKISATVSASIAVLEFLSNLIRLPQLYVSFVEAQYRSIFAIALPYTNPLKFNQYTVALAHHVIAMWFLKCRIPFRREFAKYITKALHQNVISINESISINQTKGDTTTSCNDPENSSESINFNATLHRELLEIGVDLMARFTFGMSSNVPKRSSITDFLLDKGQKCCWMIGNKVVTVTASGCATKSYKFGLCEKCYSSCRGQLEKDGYVETEPPLTEEQVPEEVEDTTTALRRRHRSAFVQSSSTIPANDMQSSCHTRDDILIHRHKQHSNRQFARRNTSYFPSGASNVSAKEESSNSEKKEGGSHLCSCWCTGWAEIHIRRPTGNTSWMFKIQNQLFLPTSPPDLPIPAISSLILPHKVGIADLEQNDKILENSEQPAEVDFNELTNPNVLQEPLYPVSEALMCPKVRVPLRRTNSSPDMNSGWSNFEGFVAPDPAIVEELRNVDPCDNQEVFDTDDELKTRSSTFHSESSRLNSSNISENSTSAEFKKHTKISSTANEVHNKVNSQYPELGNGQFRGRGHTISVMSPIRSMQSNDPTKTVVKGTHRSGMNPSFVFLQLYHDSFFGPETVRPHLISLTEANNRTLKHLDYTPPYDTHKIGIIYVGEGQVNDEQAILSNTVGSLRYIEFLRGLGNLVRLKDVDQELNYIGGLDPSGTDGKFGLVWNDDVMRVAFHVSTLMPNLNSEPKRNNKKLHIGNDFVTIVYNDSGCHYSMETIKGHVTTACVIIHPEDFGSNVVTVKLKTKELVELFGHLEAYNVSDAGLPIFVRQMALHASLASVIVNRRQHSVHVSNWLERLRILKRLHSKVLEEANCSGDSSKTNICLDPFFDDFTGYV